MTSGLFAILKRASEADVSKLQPKPKYQSMLDQHFSVHEPVDWRNFRKAVRSKEFVNALKSDERADDKLKRYAEAMNLHYTNKSGEAFTVPGHGKNYTVKFHPQVERYTCSCPDWSYARSHQVDKDKQDCKHIKMVKLELEAQKQKEKIALVLPKGISGIANTLYQKNKLDDRTIKNDAIWKAYKEQMPQPTSEGVGLGGLVTGHLIHGFAKHAFVRGLAAKQLKDSLSLALSLSS